MIKTCQHCGAVNGDPVDLCCFCDAPLGHSVRPGAVRRSATSPEHNVTLEPEWRREVSDRLHSYRARRHGGGAATAQSALPFEDDSPSVVDDDRFLPDDLAPARELRPENRRRLRTERVEISIPQRDIAYPAGQSRRPPAGQSAFGTSPDGEFAIATLALRRRAAISDIALLLFSYGGMLALFWALGGRIGLNQLDAVVTAATLVLFYAQYFTLFTLFGGCTPGMMLCRLRVLSFDGRVPTSRQMVWRSFGYLISAGTCFLGFLWALWDEDHLCWHDRISRTYLTPIDDLTSAAVSVVPARDVGRTR